AHEVAFLQFDAERALDGALDRLRRGVQRWLGSEHARKRAAKLLPQLAGWRAIFHFNDPLVVDVEEETVRQSCIARGRFGMAVVARTGDVAKEIRLAPGTRGIEIGCFLAQAGEHFAERFIYR